MPRKVYTIVEEIPAEYWGVGHEPDLPVGTVLHQWTGQQFGIVGPDQVAVSLEPGRTPFYSVPRGNVEELTHLWRVDADGNPTDSALCDTGDGTFPGGLLAHSSWQCNCKPCWDWNDDGSQPDGA